MSKVPPSTCHVLGNDQAVSIVRLKSKAGPTDGDDKCSKPKPLTPTYEAYGALQFAFDYFNRALFNGALPNVLITLTRKRNALGYFFWSRFEKRGETISHEISLNPQHMKAQGDREILSTLVHEMAHLWRYEFGPLNRRGGKGTQGYHDVVWADKMDALGLAPVNIGCGGGTRTGYHVSHTIFEGGPFDLACGALIETGFRIDWRDAPTSDSATSGDDGADFSDEEKPKRKKDKVKFTCPNRSCGLNAWAKPSARLTCTACGLPMISELDGVHLSTEGDATQLPTLSKSSLKTNQGV